MTHRDRILSHLSTAASWVMASTIGKRANLAKRTASRVLDELAHEGAIVSMNGPKGPKWALASRAVELKPTARKSTPSREALAARVEIGRKQRADAAYAVLVRQRCWVSIKFVRDECSMGDVSARQALQDLADDGRAVAHEIVVATRLGAGETITTRHYALPDVAEALGAPAIERRERPKRQEPPPVSTGKYPRLTRAENALYGGAQLELVKRYTDRIRAGDTLTTVERIEAHVQAGAYLSNVNDGCVLAKDLVDLVGRMGR